MWRSSIFWVVYSPSRVQLTGFLVSVKQLQRAPSTFRPVAPRFFNKWWTLMFLVLNFADSRKHQKVILFSSQDRFLAVRLSHLYSIGQSLYGCQYLDLKDAENLPGKFPDIGQLFFPSWKQCLLRQFIWQETLEMSECILLTFDSSSSVVLILPLEALVNLVLITKPTFSTRSSWGVFERVGNHYSETQLKSIPL